jgi:hypothetical protein
MSGADEMVTTDISHQRRASATILRVQSPIPFRGLLESTNVIDIFT